MRKDFNPNVIKNTAHKTEAPRENWTSYKHL